MGGSSTGTNTGGGEGGSGGSGGCTSVADCPTPANSCEVALCLGGQCGTTAVTAGTPADDSAQTAGDCQLLVCDGLGDAEPQDDDTDVPVDGSECTDDVCASGTPSNPLLDSGDPCGSGGALQCDGTGSCVGCTTAAPSNPPLPAGTDCGGGGSCDGDDYCSIPQANGEDCSVGSQVEL